MIQALVQKAKDPLEGTGCSNCTVLQNSVRKVENRIVTLENKAKKWKLSNCNQNTTLKVNTVLFKFLPAPLFKMKY